MLFRSTKICSTNSARVKAIEFHPSEPLLAVALYNGTLQIFDTNNFSVLKNIIVDHQNRPLRSVRFIPSMQCVIAAGDSLVISCYDYNTCGVVAQYEKAHDDYIRQIAVHPTQPYILSCSDDAKVKMFKIGNNQMKLEKTFEGHEHFVMDVKFNPKDPSTFATVSLDCTIKFWGINSTTPRFTLKGHKGGVNCLEFFPGSDKPYIATGADDYEIRIWDYQTKSCVSTLLGHQGNIIGLKFHPVYPLLFSTGEDEMFLVWNSLTMSNETAQNYQKKRGWCIDATKNLCAIGYDDGLVILKVGADSSTVVTINGNGKTYWANNNQIYSSNFNQMGTKTDGEIFLPAAKEVAISEMYPTSIAYNSTGKLVAICDGSQYGIYSELAWRAKKCGDAKEFVWGIGDTFAIKKDSQTVVVMHDFNNGIDIHIPYGCNKIFGGHLLGIATDDEITFYSWEDQSVVRLINIKACGVYWSPNNSLVAITSTDSFYILQFNEDYVEADDYNPDIGSEEAFSVITEVDKSIQGGCWYNEIFFYNDKNSINFVIGEYEEMIARVDSNQSIVGYIQKYQKLILCDSSYNFSSYEIPISVLDFLIDGTLGNPLDLSVIPEGWNSRISTFLETLGMYKEALQICDNDDKRFEYALKLNNIKLAIEIAQKTSSMQQWRLLTTIAMKEGKINILEEALRKSGDENSLLLVKSAKGLKSEMEDFAETVEETKNVQFAAYFACGNFNKCIDILISTERYPEAALMARNYAPNRMEECAKLWREFLIEKGDKRAANSIALPSEYPNMFNLPENIIETENKKEEVEIQDNQDAPDEKDNQKTETKEPIEDDELQDLLDELNENDDDLFK